MAAVRLAGDLVGQIAHKSLRGPRRHDCVQRTAKARLGAAACRVRRASDSANTKRAGSRQMLNKRHTSVQLGVRRVADTEGKAHKVRAISRMPTSERWRIELAARVARREAQVGAPGRAPSQEAIQPMLMTMTHSDEVTNKCRKFWPHGHE